MTFRTKGICLVVLLLAIIGLLTAPFFIPEIPRVIGESILNQSAKEYFAGTIRVREVRLQPSLSLRIEGVEGKLQTQNGAIPIEIAQIESKGSLLRLFDPEGLSLNFQGVRPSKGIGQGLRGKGRVRGGRHWFFYAKAEVEGLRLQDIMKLNPDFLRGAEGEMKGNIFLKAHANEEPEFKADLHVAKPGGRLQAAFFDGIMLYLPQPQLRNSLKKISMQKESVPFQNADFQVHLIQSDQIKVFLHILVPDYNLNLNLKVHIRIDEKNALQELVKIMGIVKINL